MSERGSFCTEYIYCNTCFNSFKDVLCQDNKYLKGVTIPMWTGCEGKELPIVAGKMVVCGADKNFTIWKIYIYL